MKACSIVIGILNGIFAFAFSQVHADQMSDLCAILNDKRNNQASLKQQIGNEPNPLKQNSLQQQLKQAGQESDASLKNFLKVNNRQFTNFTGEITKFEFFQTYQSVELTIRLPCNTDILFTFWPDRIQGFPDDVAPLSKWSTALETFVKGDVVIFSGRFPMEMGIGSKGFGKGVLTELSKKDGILYKVPEGTAPTAPTPITVNSHNRIPPPEAASTYELDKSGKPAHIDFNLKMKSISDPTSQFSQFGGRKTLIYYFSTKSTQCLHAFPYLQKLSDSLSSNGYTSIAITIKYNSNEDILNFIRDFKTSMPVFKDDERTFGELYGTGYVPLIFLVNKTGEYIRYKAFNDDETVNLIIKEARLVQEGGSKIGTTKSPIETVKDLFGYAGQGNSMELLKLLPKGTAPTEVTGFIEELKQLGGVKQLLVMKEAVNDQTANLEIEVTFVNEPNPREFPMALKKEDGNWKIFSMK